MRAAKEIVLASRPFAQEHRWTSWWCLWSTLAVYAVVTLLAARDGYLPVRIAASVISGLTLVRLFILFHDHQHGTILRGSRFAKVLMHGFGLISLNPSSVWKRSHDHHHRHNSRNFNPNIGSFPLMTVEGYEEASWSTRLMYVLSRHPVMIGLAYFTVFAGKMCLIPLLCNPRRHWDAALSMVLHVGVACLFPDLTSLLLGWLLPFLIGSGCGAYLFFAQHNFPGVKLQSDGQWDYVTSALSSSSYYEMGPIMRWFTGNIGFHHVHHLNAKIPFYRLPEAMAAIEELQSPVTLTLSLRDIVTCLSLKLWDANKRELVCWQPMSAKAKALAPLPLQPVLMKKAG